MFAEKRSVEITTDASGDGTGFIPVPYGRLMALIYTKGDYADGVDVTTTIKDTGEAVWSESNVNASAVRYPRVAVHDTSGAAALFASGGEAVVEPLVIAADEIKVVIAQGGNAKSGTFTAIIA